MGHRLVFYENRSTPQVVGESGSAKSKAGYGKVTHSRPANASEEKTIARGGWVRVDSKGNKPSSSSYKASSYRPQLGEKRRATNKRIAKAAGIPNAGAIVRPPKPPQVNGFKPPQPFKPQTATKIQGPKPFGGEGLAAKNPAQAALKQTQANNAMKNNALNPNVSKSDSSVKSTIKDVKSIKDADKIPDNVAIALPNAAVKAHDGSKKNKKKALAGVAAAKIAGAGAGMAAGYGIYRVSRGKIKALHRPDVTIKGKKYLKVSSERKQGAAASAATTLGGSVGGYIGGRKSLESIKNDRKYGYAKERK